MHLPAWAGMGIRFWMSDISEHLPLLKEYAKDKEVLELGVRSGESTRSFLESAAHVTSLDRDDCSGVSSSKKWLFIKGDSLLARIDGQYGIIFIDTSHRFRDTLLELRKYSPMLARGGAIILHDANPPFTSKYIRMRGGVL